jgi:hypothetical protein
LLPTRRGAAGEPSSTDFDDAIDISSLDFEPSTR